VKLKLSGRAFALVKASCKYVGEIDRPGRDEDEILSGMSTRELQAHANHQRQLGINVINNFFYLKS